MNDLAKQAVWWLVILAICIAVALFAIALHSAALSKTFLALHLVRLTGPENQVVLINPEQVVSLREPRGQGEHFHAGVKCLIFTGDSKYTPVTQTCAEVRAKLQQSEEVQ